MHYNYETPLDPPYINALYTNFRVILSVIHCKEN